MGFDDQKMGPWLVDKLTYPLETDEDDGTWWSNKKFAMNRQIHVHSGAGRRPWDRMLRQEFWNPSTRRTFWRQTKGDVGCGDGKKGPVHALLTQFTYFFDKQHTDIVEVRNILFPQGCTNNLHGSVRARKPFPTPTTEIGQISRWTLELLHTTSATHHLAWRQQMSHNNVDMRSSGACYTPFGVPPSSQSCSWRWLLPFWRNLPSYLQLSSNCRPRLKCCNPAARHGLGRSSH